jgi:hypothetical protein
MSSSRTYEVEGTKITIIDADKNAEEAAIQLTTTIKATAKIREIATNPIALACIEKYAINAEKLVRANELLKETMKAQESLFQFIKNKDYDNFTKSAIPATKKFRETKALIESIEFPPVNDDLKKIFTPSINANTTTLSSQKAAILKQFNSCIDGDALITKCAKKYIAKKKEIANASGAAQVQPAPVANANPAAFMHSNAKSAAAASAAAKPGAQPQAPNNNQKAK